LAVFAVSCAFAGQAAAQEEGSWVFVEERNANGAVNRSAAAAVAQPNFELVGDGKVVYYDPRQGWFKGDVESNSEGMTFEFDVPSLSNNARNAGAGNSKKKQVKRVKQQGNQLVLEEGGRTLVFQKAAKKNNKQDKNKIKKAKKAKKLR